MTHLTPTMTYPIPTTGHGGDRVGHERSGVPTPTMIHPFPTQGHGVDRVGQDGVG